MNRECEIVQKLFILKLDPDLDPEPEKLCEHGASFIVCVNFYFQQIFISHTTHQIYTIVLHW